mmetsp:Transcript_19427/g.55887  ORF Transcript_19427/g.55887 Transcript_19427/m.55887 type:complete len:429 (-) Transcript_19427:85-1371(-)|eukprot:CAMPEP_0181035056 /NCGR_PEP_ID=MMETSP1070-20121207/8125_1 /TAXON_ID=265543 /ORGANISM="Minutocellus polymorphus, Strain NH13" /LENGTH=428 /DNA_ID=CAMNT_0023112601 /DNA_START=20 /DNA_END=1306 /DNA_ORIENTATION=+
MSELPPPTKRARVAKAPAPVAPPPSGSSPLKSDPQSRPDQDQPTFADVAYVLGQSKVLHFRQLAKNSLLLSKEVSACMFPNRSDLWVRLCRDRFGGKMMKQLEQAKLLSQDDIGTAGGGGKFERLFRMLAVKGMRKDRGWTPIIPEDAECIASTDISETETFDGKMPELKELEYKPENYWFVLQLFSDEGDDKAPLLSKVFPGTKLSNFFTTAHRIPNEKQMIPFDEPVVLASTSGADTDMINSSYPFYGKNTKILGPLHATVHAIRCNGADGGDCLCICDNENEGSEVRGYYTSGHEEVKKRMEFHLGGSTAIALGGGAKQCFDLLEYGIEDYLPDHGASLAVKLTCEARGNDDAYVNEDGDPTQSFSIITTSFQVLPKLHYFQPSCFHSKCRHCIDREGEDEDVGPFYSFNGVTFAHILENAKGWE